MHMVGRECLIAAHRVLGVAKEGAAAGAHFVGLAAAGVVVYHLTLLQVRSRLEAGGQGG